MKNKNAIIAVGVLLVSLKGWTASENQQVLMSCQGKYQGQVLEAQLIGRVPLSMRNTMKIRLGQTALELIPAITGTTSSMPKPVVETVPSPEAANKENAIFPYFSFGDPRAPKSTGSVSVKRDKGFGADSVTLKCVGLISR